MLLELLLLELLELLLLELTDLENDKASSCCDNFLERLSTHSIKCCFM
jgi:hypothetical protein